MEIIEQIKAIAREGEDLTGIEAALTGLNPLNAVKDKEAAWELIKSNSIMLSAFDRKQTERAETVEKNIMSGKFLDAIKVKEAEIRAELQPDETEVQRLSRELAEYKASVDNEKAEIQRKDDLSRKAEDVKFSPSLAKELSALGDKAEPLLDSFMEWHKAELDRAINAEVREKYGKEIVPKRNIDVNNLTSLADSDLHELARTNPKMKTAIIAEINARNKPRR